ncbi:unnamed protein product [Symbiodinium sp. CCMP2592]|nr:unnamed protein product [Symbiodinium sp. CCMP2592]CAE7256173.1 unnamed protein product [Symbiodinium sp. CCMP2592]
MTRRMSLLVFAAVAAAAVAADAAADACDQSVLLQTQKTQKTESGWDPTKDECAGRGGTVWDDAGKHCKDDEAPAMPDCGGGPLSCDDHGCKCQGDVKAKTLKGGCPEGTKLKLSIDGSGCVEDKPEEPKEPKPARCEFMGKLSHLKKEYDCGAYTSEKECYTNRLKNCAWKPAEP